MLSRYKVKAGNPRQNHREQASGNRYLGHLERHISGMTNDLCPDPDQFVQ